MRSDSAHMEHFQCKMHTTVYFSIQVYEHFGITIIYDSSSDIPGFWLGDVGELGGDKSISSFSTPPPGSI